MKRLNLDVEKMCEEYLIEGATTRDLAEKYKCSVDSIIKRIKNSNNKLAIEKLTRQWLTNPRKLTLDLDNIAKDRESGLTFKEIALNYGCHEETIRRRLSKHINGKEITIEEKLTLNKNLSPEFVAVKYLEKGMSTSKLAEVFGCDMELIRRRIWESNNEIAKEKLRTNQDRNPSEIFVENDHIYVVAINTEKRHKFDYDFLLLQKLQKQGNWREDSGGYLYSNYEGINFFKAYWLVTGVPEGGIEVDHVDLDHSNNTKNNLRFVTKTLNLQNFKTKTNNTSGYMGVSYNNKEKKWIARLGVNKVRYMLGYFGTKEEAALAYFNTKYNLFGFEYIPHEEQQKYNELLTYFATIN